MLVRYRFVPYGTSFVACGGPRPPQGAKPNQLYENEIAADVGSAFWPATATATLAVIDHHFAGSDQFPSASAAILHSCEKVGVWWDRVAGFPEVWLVTHVEPDFDAYASLYLIRSLREWRELKPMEFAMAPDVWRHLTPTEAPPEGALRFDWFKAPAAGVEPEVRWRIMVAVIASYADACRRTSCPKTQTAPAILYAAVCRGRDLQRDGGAAIFEFIRSAVVDCHANPLTDAIFESSVEFAPEVALLAREQEAYHRDLSRARRVIVTVPSYNGAFDNYYDSKRLQPLLDDRMEPQASQLAADGPPSAVDGIYLRDPECILFKDLARMDIENSSQGQGFLFTAVAYSSGRPKSGRNHTDYYFALDPERAGTRTLYPLWCRVQAAEVRALQRPELAALRTDLAGRKARDWYVERAASHQELFSDPWFDGNAFRNTLVVTPYRGTEIGEAGTSAEMTDDPVAALVRRELEYRVYAGEAQLIDYGDATDKPVESFVAMDQAKTAKAERTFRFCSVPLIAGLSIDPGLQSQQIGEQLWHILQPFFLGLPSDFIERHLTQEHNLVAVWSRHGLAIAYCPEAKDRVEAVKADFGRTVTLLDQMLKTVRMTDEQALERAEDLLRDVAVRRQELSKPGNLLAFRRFVDAIGFVETIATARDLLAARAGRLEVEESQGIAKETKLLTGATSQSAEATSRSIAAVEAGNRKMEMLEILIVTMYSVELLNILMEALSKGPEGAIKAQILTVVGMIVALLAWWGIARHDEEKRWNPVSLVPIITIIVLALVFATTFDGMADWRSRLFGQHENPSSGEGTNPSSATQPPAQAAPAPAVAPQK